MKLANAQPREPKTAVSLPAPTIEVDAGSEMHTQLTRHAVQVLAKAGVTQTAIGEQLGVSTRTVRRILREAPVTDVDDAEARRRRNVGRPAVAAPFESFVVETLSESPELKTLEVLRRARERGYDGGKTAFYDLVARLRDDHPEWVMRFEGLPGEFSQHDFGQVDVSFVDGGRKRMKFFASRLKYSRYVAVSLVPNEKAETLVRGVLDHFVAFGGVPLLAVFDRPKTVAKRWRKDGTITDWNPVFSQAAMDIGFGAEVCWPRSPRQKGSVENLVGWVKGSFFKQRRFRDEADLLDQLAEWHVHVNEHRPSRATGEVPAARLAAERARMRPPRVTPDELALRLTAYVGPTGYVRFENHSYAMPPRAAGMVAKLFIYRNRIRIEAGRYEAIHERRAGDSGVSTLPDQRAEQLASLSGARGRRYLARQHLLELGDPAEVFLTALVHRNPKGWYRDVERIHKLLQQCGNDAIRRALRAAVDVDRADADYIEHIVRPRQTRLFNREADR